MTTVVLDCMGGDNSPVAHVKGAVNAINSFDDLSVVLTGKKEILDNTLKGIVYDKNRLTVLDAPEVITGNDKPTDAVRFKKESSMMKGVYMLCEKENVDAFVTTGSSGALVAAGVLKIGRVPNVIRPAFCPVISTLANSIVAICDCGANAECQPDMLQQFAIMGSIYLENVYNIKKPRVALLNIGKEPHKGTEMHQNAYSLLSETKGINFVGNMESRDLLSGKYDIVVSDGFSGNVLIKTTEGTAIELLTRIKKDMGTSESCNALKNIASIMNYQNYGGTVLLGVKKNVVKGHGSSNETAIFKCIEQAYLMSKNNITSKIEDIIAQNLKEGNF